MIIEKEHLKYLIQDAENGLKNAELKGDEKTIWFWKGKITGLEVSLEVIEDYYKGVA
tara:strand:- start:15 stop:185 length:171 start_codon:yes stop_codon:yes gene_type:complete